MEEPVRREIVRKPEEQQEFQPLLKRWTVERTCAWLGKWRLSKDELVPATGESVLRAAMIGIMLRRLDR